MERRTSVAPTPSSDGSSDSESAESTDSESSDESASEAETKKPITKSANGNGVKKGKWR